MIPQSLLPRKCAFQRFGVFNGIHIPPTNGERRVQSEICAGLRCAKVSQDAGGLVGNLYQTLCLWVYDALCIKRLTMASQQVLLLFFDRKRYRLISLACCRHGLFPLPHDLHRRGRGTSSAGHPSKELSANADSLPLSCGKTKNKPSPLLQEMGGNTIPTFARFLCLMLTRNLGLSFKIIYPLVL